MTKGLVKVEFTATAWVHVDDGDVGGSLDVINDALDGADTLDIAGFSFHVADAHIVQKGLVK